MSPVPLRAAFDTPDLTGRPDRRSLPATLCASS